VLRLKAPSPPPSFQSALQLTWRGNPEGFNRSQSIDLQCTNKRHGPAASSSSITPPALTVQILANRSWAGAGLETRRTASYSTQSETIRDVPCSGDTSLSKPSTPCPPPAATSYFLVIGCCFRRRRRLIYRCLPQCKVTRYEHMPTHLSMYIFVYCPSEDDGKLMNHLL
jgi:hypothetical protein